MKPKTMMLVLIAIGCGVGAAWYYQNVMGKREQPIKILVAKQNIKKWDALTTYKEMFGEIDLLPSQYPPGLKEPASIEKLLKLRFGTENNAKYYAVDTSLKKYVEGQTKLEECVLTMDNVIERAAASLAAILRPGYKGFGIRATAEGFAGGLLQKDNYIQIYVAKRARDKSGKEYFKPKMVMQQIRIIAVDMTTEQAGTGPTAAGTTPIAARIPSTITLEVTDAEAARLTLAAREGPLSVAVIATADMKESATSKERMGEEWEDPDQPGDKPSGEEKKEKVFVASRQLRQWQPLKDYALMFELKDIPSWKKPDKAVTPDNFDEFKKLINDHMIVKNMYPDEPLSLDLLAKVQTSAAPGSPNSVHFINGPQQETYQEGNQGILQPLTPLRPIAPPTQPRPQQ